MKLIIMIVMAGFFVSCETKPYINHEMKADRIGDCVENKGSYRVTANINGERYEFAYCLKDGFDGKDYSVTRRGDTLLVDMPEPRIADKTAMYKLILDINAYPKYDHIKIGADVLNVVVTGN